MDLVNMNRGKCTLWWIKLPEQYFTQHLDYRAMLILLFVYMSFRFKEIFFCHLSYCQYLMTLLDYSQIKISSTVLSNCKCS
jgi:hypothetical protein